LREFLLISYLYPPVINSGTQHIIRFARYLPDVGYHPIILTSATRGDLPDDALNDVFRAREFWGAVKRFYRARHFQKTSNTDGTSTTITPQSGIGRLLRQWAIPDLQVTWYPLALRHGRMLVKAYSIEMLYSTSGPETNHLVALELKRETGLPWVADFRDGWLFEPLIEARSTIRLRHTLEVCLERAVVRNADHIVILNQRMADDLYARYPEAASKVTIISNGFDASEFASIERQPNGKFTLVHTGALELSRRGTSIGGFLEALARLKRENHAILQDLHIIMIGRLTDDEITAIRASGVITLFTMIDQMAHSEALQYQVNAEVLFLITHPTDLAISTTKLFEYLGARRPILALTPKESSAAHIIEETRTGVIAPPDDPATIYSALVALYDQWRRSELGLPADSSVNRYEYRFLTSQLARLFDRAIRT
jgi:glycosyltransferase involved in cell wall biosynthesis